MNKFPSGASFSWLSVPFSRIDWLSPISGDRFYPSRWSENFGATTNCSRLTNASKLIALKTGGRHTQPIFATPLQPQSQIIAISGGLEQTKSVGYLLLTKIVAQSAIISKFR